MLPLDRHYLPPTIVDEIIEPYINLGHLGHLGQITGRDINSASDKYTRLLLFTSGQASDYHDGAIRRRHPRASVDRACDQAATPTLPAPTEHTIRRTTLQPTVRDSHARFSAPSWRAASA